MLFGRNNPLLKRGSIDDTLESLAASHMLDRSRPAYWFSEHIHCRLLALKRHEAPLGGVSMAPQEETTHSDEISLEMGSDEEFNTRTSRSHV